MTEPIIASILGRPDLLKDARPRISRSDLEATQESLGFELPDLLRTLYLEVGNGGFGPHFKGFMGGINGHEDELGANIVSRYHLCRSSPERHPWPERLLTFFNWGCACTCSLDCSHADGPVIFHDPGYDVRHYAEDDFRRQRDPVVEDPVPEMRIEARNLKSWLQVWLDGTAKMGYGKRRWRPATKPVTSAPERVDDRQFKLKL